MYHTLRTIKRFKYKNSNNVEAKPRRLVTLFIVYQPHHIATIGAALNTTVTWSNTMQLVVRLLYLQQLVLMNYEGPSFSGSLIQIFPCAGELCSLLTHRKLNLGVAK